MSVRRGRALPILGFRYSTSRDAYVLRVVGDRVGPVFQVQAAGGSSSAKTADGVDVSADADVQTHSGSGA